MQKQRKNNKKGGVPNGTPPHGAKTTLKQRKNNAKTTLKQR